MSPNPGMNFCATVRPCCRCGESDREILHFVQNDKERQKGKERQNDQGRQNDEGHCHVGRRRDSLP